MEVKIGREKKKNRSFEYVSQFKYLGITVANQFDSTAKLRGDLITVMLDIIRSRTICLLVCCRKTCK
jgi:hypothetical protein